MTTLICSSFTGADDCNKLNDGKYKVAVSTNGYQDFELLIDKKRFTQSFKDGQQSSGTVEWLDCDLVLRYERPKVNLDSLDKFERAIYLMGDICYEMEKTKGRKTKFRLTRTGNRHITINEGRFIKLN